MLKTLPVTPYLIVLISLIDLLDIFFIPKDHFSHKKRIHLHSCHLEMVEQERRRALKTAYIYFTAKGSFIQLGSEL